MSAELGSMLVKAGKITEAQLTRALEIQKNSKEKLTTILVKIGALADEDDVSEFIGRQLNMGTLRLADIELNPEVVKLIPLDIARKFNVIAISKLGKKVRTNWELRTNQDGIASIPPIQRGKIMVQVIAKGHQTFGQTFDVTEPEKTIAVTLNPPQSQYSSHQ